jgi:hypothetical protein
MPLFWVLSAFAWWWLPFRSAIGLTIGLVVLTIVTRAYRERFQLRFRRYPRVPAVRVHEPEDARVRIGAERDEEEEEQGAERLRRGG